MIHNRDGKIDVTVGCSVENGEITAYRRPRIANINETVGSYAIALMSGQTVRQHNNNLFDLEISTPQLPNTNRRIKIGASINSVLVPVGIATCSLAAYNLTMTVMSACDSLRSL